MLDELAAALRRHADRPALLAAGPAGRPRVLATRGDLADLADGYAAALHHRGLAAGDTLGVAVRPGARALAVLLAAHRLGLRVAVLDPSAGPDVLTARLALARPRAGRGRRRRPGGRRLGAAAGPPGPAGPARAGRARPGAHRRAAAARLRAGAACPRAGRHPTRRGDDGDAVIIFTSGTTSRPRAVVHTRRARRRDARASPTWSGRARRAGARRHVLRAGAGAGQRRAGGPAGPVAPAARPPVRPAAPAGQLPHPAAAAGAARAAAAAHRPVYSGSAPVSATLLRAGYGGPGPRRRGGCTR